MRHGTAVGLPVFAYSSLVRGFFSGRITRATRDQADELLDGASRRAYCHGVNFDRLNRVEELARERDVTVPQIAMAYVMQQPLNLFALVGAANERELDDALAALDIELTPAELG